MMTQPTSSMIREDTKGLKQRAGWARERVGASKPAGPRVQVPQVTPWPGGPGREPRGESETTDRGSNPFGRVRDRLRRVGSRRVSAWNFRIYVVLYKWQRNWAVSAKAVQVLFPRGFPVYTK